MMSGVYIKGMKMPKNCWECKFEKVSSNHAEGTYCVCIITEKHIDDGQESWCPLLPVPPHGRLIDADELYKRVILGRDEETYAAEQKNSLMHIERAYGLDMALPLIAESKTIIEAEEEIQ